MVRCAYSVHIKVNGPHLDFSLTKEGHTITGLPSLRNLELISHHCTIKDKGPINSIVELTNSYPNQFDHIGHFKSDYHIVLKPDHHLMIHAPRKCPIHLRDEIEDELKTMESQNIIRKVSEPTEWVSSIVYIRKKNGKRHLCLDPKDLNRDSNLHNLMRIAQTEGLCFNSEKCVIDKKQIHFLVLSTIRMV